MSSMLDEKGHSQGYVSTKALEIRTRRRSQRILDEMTDGESVRVLELGCGTGDLAFELACHIRGQVMGVDVSKKFIDEALAKHRRENLKFEVLDVRKMEILKEGLGHYHYIVGNGILHHLYYELDWILTVLRSLLVPGGKLIFWEPSLFNPYAFLIFNFAPFRKLFKLDPEEMAFTGGFIKSKLTTAGFSNSRVIYLDFLLPNTPDSLIQPLIGIGEVIERIPVANRLAQSLFITAQR